MVNEKKLKAVIFDMDGVIFDSERTILESWRSDSSSLKKQKNVTGFWKKEN